MVQKTIHCFMVFFAALGMLEAQPSLEKRVTVLEMKVSSLEQQLNAIPVTEDFNNIDILINTTMLTKGLDVKIIKGQILDAVVTYKGFATEPVDPVKVFISPGEPGEIANIPGRPNVKGSFYIEDGAIRFKLIPGGKDGDKGSLRFSVHLRYKRAGI